MRLLLPLALLACAYLLQALPALAAGSTPPATDDLTLQAPIDTWDEAVPMGNGLMGGLLWGNGGTLRLSLDRGDLWDERPAGDPNWWKKQTWAEGKKRIEAGDAGTVNQWWDAPYNGVSPTKLPAGRVELDLGGGARVERFRLHLATAEASAEFSGGRRVSAFASATQPVILLHVSGPAPAVALFTPLQVLRRAAGADAGPSSGGSVDRLGYPEAVTGAGAGAQWYVQEASQGLRYCVYVETKPVQGGSLLAVTVAATTDGPDPLAIARKRCADAFRRGRAGLLRAHVDWWQRFWSASAVDVPDDAVRRQYLLSRYLLGAGSRRGAPPIPLQGVWTADTGGLPPWKGDYHNDLNTQMTYISYQAAGHFEQGLSYLDLLWKLRPTFREFARSFYGVDGLATPGVMSLAGQPLGGWGQYSMSPTMTSWNAHIFYLHWRYTGSPAFLRDRAYPWCLDAARCLRSLLKPDAQGVLALPLSSSPEIHGNSAEAWVRPNSNYDLMSLKMQFLAVAEMADALGKTAEAAEWLKAAAALGDFHADARGELLIDPVQPLAESHRHLSNLIGLYPFNLLTVEGDDTARRRIDASLAQWARLGTSQWCGYSFGWMSALQARAGRSDEALRLLQVFTKAFVLRNGFHANGDQTRSGYSSFTYRPFTLEGNFVAMQALQEMLLQSWSPTPGQRGTEVIRLFPATPAAWPDASFSDLRAEGGHRVSARRRGGKTVWLKLVAGSTGVVRIRDTFAGRTPRWSRPGVTRAGADYLVRLAKGEALEATLE